MNCNDLRPGITAELTSELRLNYEEVGEGEPAVLFVHGFGASLRNWDDVRPYLEFNGRKIFVDLKGCGFSSRPDDSEYSVQDQALVLSLFLTRLEVDDVILVGHSYGGAIVLLLYQHLVDTGEGANVRALILIDSAGYADDNTFPLNQLRLPIWGSVVVHLLPASVQVNETLGRAFYDSSKITTRIRDRYACFYDDPQWRRALLMAGRHAVPQNAAEVRAKFALINKPVLIIWGAQDRIIPFTHAQRFASAIRTATIEMIPECGHIPQEEQPRKTGESISLFVTEQRKGR